jgi:hypothetical protein
VASTVVGDDTVTMIPKEEHFWATRKY